MAEQRKGRQTPTQSVVLPYFSTKGQDAIDSYNQSSRTAQEWQELLLCDILAVNEDGLWVHTKFGLTSLQIWSIIKQKVVEGAYSRIKTSKSIMELRREISRYSLTDESETLAEAVEDYYCNGYSASILSRQIMRILKEELR